MKKNVAILSLFFWLASAAIGFGADDFDKKIVGTWEQTEIKSMKGYSVFEAGGTGASVGQMTRNDKTVWMLVLFNWKIADGKLVQTITKGNLPNMSVGSSSTDSIVSIDNEWYTHKSGKKTDKDKRVEALPPAFAKKLAEFRQKK